MEVEGAREAAGGGKQDELGRPTTASRLSPSASLDASRLMTRTESPWARAVRRFRRHRLAVAGVVVLAVLGVMAVFAPVVGQHDPNRGDFRHIDERPSREPASLQ